MVLLGTSKNAGLAAGLALTLFGRETAVPSTVQTIFMLIYVILLDLRKSQLRSQGP
jgi:BASS family bile acid:Na+ symporter